MTELELLVDLHINTKRQGPGSSEETKKALSLIGFDKSKKLDILDIGAGTGAQTITLAQNTNSNIIAVDLFPEFLEKLRLNSKELNLQNRIKPQACSMDNLPFQKVQFDLIWSEGAIYNMGFEAGVQQWKPFLTQNGFLAVSEISWITDSRPKELEDFWTEEYPEIDTVSNKIKVLEKNGYSPIAHFVLPESSWLDNYYRPLEQEYPDFLLRNKNTEIAKQVVEASKKEMKFYQKYKSFYSYGFYIAQKIKSS